MRTAAEVLGNRLQELGLPRVNRITQRGERLHALGVSRSAARKSGALRIQEISERAHAFPTR